MTSRFSKLVLVFLGFLLTVQPGFAQTSFSGVVAFGDSLTDGGNTNSGNGSYSTNTQAQSGNGYNGTWAVQLAAKLGYTLTPSNSGGNNWAVSGQNTTEIAAQVTSYLSHTGGTASPTTLYLILGGINDSWSDQPSAQASANRLNNAIVTLINAGAKYIMWVNMLSADLSPALQSSQYTNFRNTVGYFNAQWAADVVNLRSSYPSVTLYALDEYRQWQLLAANAGVFGIIYTSQGFTQAPASVPGSAASSNPNADLFSTWDGGHPTTYIHYLTAANAYAVLSGVPMDGTYNIANLNSGLNLDTVNQSTSNAVVDQATPNSNYPTQKWDLVNIGISPNQYVVINDSNGRLLDVYGQATNSGATVVTWDSNGGTNQRWTISSASGSYILTGLQSGNVLDVYGFSTANGGTVNMWAPNGGSNQKWLMNRLDQSPTPK